jgi:hypothetical protein
MAKTHIRATGRATGHLSPGEAQTGKCPTSGDFFAIFRAVMGCFCPQTGEHQHHPGVRGQLNLGWPLVDIPTG